MKHPVLFIVLLLFNYCYGQSSIASEELILYNDSIQLPGTLTYNKDIDLQPLVVYIQGSGNPDRNGNQLAFGVKANYIKLLRDALNKNGIAFYSYDKRNVTKSNIPLFADHFMFNMLVEDAQVAIDHFKSDKRFGQLVLIGHSQGSLVGMLAINNSVDKYVSLAGIGEPVDKTIIRQLNAQNPEFGKIAEKHFQELKTTGSIAEVNPMLASIFAKANQEFLVSYMKHDPSEDIKSVTIPSLIVNGERDLQVGIADAEKLHKSNKTSELVLIKNMNHVLKTVESDTDNQASYYSEDFPLSEELVVVLTNFIKKK